MFTSTSRTPSSSCLAVGGILLLIAVLVGDVLGGILDGIGLDFDLGGVSLMPLLLASVAMFGVGGLIGTEALAMSSGPASLVGALSGTLGAAHLGCPAEASPRPVRIRDDRHDPRAAPAPDALA